MVKWREWVDRIMRKQRFREVALSLDASGHGRDDQLSQQRLHVSEEVHEGEEGEEEEDEEAEEVEGKRSFSREVDDISDLENLESQLQSLEGSPYQLKEPISFAVTPVPPTGKTPFSLPIPLLPKKSGRVQLLSSVALRSDLPPREGKGGVVPRSSSASSVTRSKVAPASAVTSYSLGDFDTDSADFESEPVEELLRSNSGGPTSVLRSTARPQSLNTATSSLPQGPQRSIGAAAVVSVSQRVAAAAVTRGDTDLLGEPSLDERIDGWAVALRKALDADQDGDVAYAVELYSRLNRKITREAIYEYENLTCDQKKLLSHVLTSLDERTQHLKQQQRSQGVAGRPPTNNNDSLKDPSPSGSNRPSLSSTSSSSNRPSLSSTASASNNLNQSLGLTDSSTMKELARCIDTLDTIKALSSKKTLPVVLVYKERRHRTQHRHEEKGKSNKVIFPKEKRDFLRSLGLPYKMVTEQGLDFTIQPERVLPGAGDGELNRSSEFLPTVDGEAGGGGGGVGGGGGGVGGGGDGVGVGGGGERYRETSNNNNSNNALEGNNKSTTLGKEYEPGDKTNGNVIETVLDGNDLAVPSVDDFVITRTEVVPKHFDSSQDASSASSSGEESKKKTKDKENQEEVKEKDEEENKEDVRSTLSCDTCSSVGSSTSDHEEEEDLPTDIAIAGPTYAHIETLQPPPFREAGKQYISLVMEKIGVHNTGHLVCPFLSFSLRDAEGEMMRIEKGQDTPLLEVINRHYFRSSSTIHLSTPLDDLPEESYLFIELRHYRPERQVVSVTCYTFLERKHITNGEFVCELHVPPVEYTRKNLKSYTEKALFLHFQILLEKEEEPEKEEPQEEEKGHNFSNISLSDLPNSKTP
ncbi:uncharacterized protein LOC143037979 [Oratosquilla oratoria]|uniref:uncharacterized protein LOC143037979 n=1 Tax=Oratosquilla oratoria TaxID=337810 RepID=UPI003F758563